MKQTLFLVLSLLLTVIVPDLATADVVVPSDQVVD
jgi:hypothetical protein